MTSLNNISTQWTEIENLQQQGELRELTNYLAVRYFNPITKAFKDRCSRLDEQQALELTSDIFYDFIKNDYRYIKKIERGKKLRGVFYTIIRRKLSRLPEQLLSLEEFDKEEKNWECYTDIMLELDTTLKKLEEERAELYEPFILYTFQGKKMLEISQQLELTLNAVKLRVCNARKFIAVYMKDYWYCSRVLWKS